LFYLIFFVQDYPNLTTGLWILHVDLSQVFFVFLIHSSMFDLLINIDRFFYKVIIFLFIFCFVIKYWDFLRIFRGYFFIKLVSFYFFISHWNFFYNYIIKLTKNIEPIKINELSSNFFLFFQNHYHWAYLFLC